MGNTAGHRYKEFRYVVENVVISGSDTFTVEFYPLQDFMDERTNNDPVMLAVGAAVLILLCTGLFVLYDVSMRNQGTPLYTEMCIKPNLFILKCVLNPPPF
jgi:hypothetical protein